MLECIRIAEAVKCSRDGTSEAANQRCRLHPYLSCGHTEMKSSVCYQLYEVLVVMSSTVG
jgi:hypothetical protein